MSDESARRGANARIFIGVLIIAWGLMMTAVNFGLLHWSSVRWLFGLWPLALVAFGVGKMLSADAMPGRVAGALVAFVGLLWTGEHVFDWHIHIRQWWPLILVAVGAMLVARALDTTAATPGAAAPSTRSSGRELALFSGIERRISAPDYRGTDLTTIMGGVNIDLRGSATATGEAVIDLLTILGGVQIKVPPDWAVVNQITPILGGVEDRSTGGKDAQHRLIIRGTVILGGVEIGT